MRVKMFKSSHPIFFALVIVTIAALLYWPGLSGGWLFDDFHNIVSNSRVHATQLDAATLATAAGAYDREGGLMRPLATTWFAIDYYLGGGTPKVFKINGLLVHLGNVLLVFWLLMRILSLPAASISDAGRRTWIAGTIALVWAVHPLQVSTVLYVVQRMETLSLTFVLLALHAYIAGRRRQIEGKRGTLYLAACLPFLALGLAAKESALLFPVYALGLELTVFNFSAKTDSGARAWRRFYQIGVVLGLAIFAFYVFPRYANDEVYAIRNFDVLQRMLTQCRVLPMYLGQIVLPLPQGMTFYYDDLTVSTSLLEPLSTLFGALLIVTLLTTALWLRTRMPLYSLGVLWFFGAHLLTSNVIPLEMVFEHRNYFALLGVLIAGYDLLRRVPIREGSPLPRAAGAALLTGLFALTLLRSATWGGDLLLALDLVAKNPASSRASNDLGALYFELAKNDPDSPFATKAVQEFERLAGRANASPIPEQALISMQTAFGHSADDELWQRLIHKIEQRPISPEEVMSVTSLLKLSEDGHAIDNVRLSQAYRILLSRSKQSPRFYIRCGMHALFQLKDEALARQLLLQSVELSDANSLLPEQIAEMLDADGHRELAAAVRAAGAAELRHAPVATD